MIKGLDFSKFENPTIQVVWEDLPENFTQDKIKSVKHYFSKKYNTTNVNVLTKAKITNTDEVQTVDVSVNITDANYQLGLMKQYLEGKGLTGHTYEVLSINRIVENKILEKYEETTQFKKWYIKNIEFSNFLSYGENQKLDLLILVSDRPPLFGKYKTLAQEHIALVYPDSLDFKIERVSLEAMSQLAPRLSIISQERITDELNKMILTKTPSRAFKLLHVTGLLEQFFPEMIALQGIETREGKAHKDNFLHTLEVLDNLALHSNNLWLRWAAILHDIAKAPTKRFDPQVGWTFHGHEELGSKMVPRLFKRLRLPLDHQMKYVQKLVRLHLRPIALVKGSVTDAAIRRLLHEAGDDIEDLKLGMRATFSRPARPSPRPTIICFA